VRRLPHHQPTRRQRGRRPPAAASGALSRTGASLPLAAAPQLEQLLGVRSSKGRYYREYRHSRHDLERTLAAVNAVSWILASATGDPRRLVGDTLPVVAQLLDARGVVLDADHPGLGAGQVQLAVTHPGTEGPPAEALTATVAAQVARCSHDDLLSGVLRAAPELDGTVLVVPLPRAGSPCGWVAALLPTHVRADATDLAILGTLTNQLAGAIESAHRLAESERMRGAATAALGDAASKAGALERRNAQLRQTRHELLAARDRQVVADERQRIARDLHDSVAQHVLSMGMQVEWCRTTSTEPDVVDRLCDVKELARSTVGRIRQAIFELGGADELGPGLVPALRRMAEQHRVHGLTVGVRVVGEPRRLAAGTERALFMVAKEALFNTVVHAEATRASLHVAFAARHVRLVVSDDGQGRAAQLRSCLQQTRTGCHSGYHRGLGNIDERVRLVGGRLTFADAPGRGVRLQVVVPAGDAA
jgi:signal transduction histidine kinase